MVWADALRLGRFLVRTLEELREQQLMALLSKDQIWQANDITFEDVPVPEWSPPGQVGHVRLRGLMGNERDEFEAKSLKKVKGGQREVEIKNLRARLIAACAISEDGSPLFTAGDVMRLSQKSAVPLERLFKVAQRLSGLSDDDVEELVEDFDDAQSGPSTSDSPRTSATPSPSSSSASPPAS
jgi:hypothetical protein